MKKPASSFREWVIWTLRKASYRWPPRGQALARAKATKQDYIDNPGEKVTARIRNFYFCAKCERVFSRKGVSVDHIIPVVDPKKGFTTFDDYIKRLFCALSGFQVLCTHCHDLKTKKEGKVRTMIRRLHRERA